jgi:hypothetical protein
MRHGMHDMHFCTHISSGCAFSPTCCTVICSLQETLQNFERCAICNQLVTPPPPTRCLQGLAPSGTMAITTSSQIFCQGCWAPRGSIVISYFLPVGVQKFYHDNPGAAFSSTNFRAYLPYNEEGIMLLRRLQYAFLFGLSFTVQTRIVDGGARGSVVWSSIPHKQRPSASGLLAENCDSYPDPLYFDRCNHELDKWGVPKYEDCQSLVRKASQHCQNNNEHHHWLKNPLEQFLESKFSGECRKILHRLQEHQHGWMFCKTLPILEGKIERPMDLSKVEKKLSRDEYKSLDDFCDDVILTFDNAIIYHSKENPIHFMAKQLKKKFKKDFKEMAQSLELK